MDPVQSNDKKHITLVKYSKEYWDKHLIWTKQNL